jgi:hypothetical protein
LGQRTRSPRLECIHELRDNIQFVDIKRPSPSLLPVLRSRQQGDLLMTVLTDAANEFSLRELEQQLRIPYATVHRDIERAERAGLIQSRKVGRTRLVRANTESPYFTGLADVLLKAFGPPWVLSRALRSVAGIERALLFGSWAARYHDIDGKRPVGDIDLLVLGRPDRDALYRATSDTAARLGRDVQVTMRGADWLEHGAGTFHDTVTRQPLVEVPLKRSG